MDSLNTDFKLKKAKSLDLWMSINKTIAIYLSYFGVGMSIVLPGMSIVHMEYYLGASAETMVFTFFLAYGSWGLGSIVCGFVFEKINPEKAFAFALFAGGVAFASAGMAPHIAVFLACIALNGISFGFFDTALQSYSIRIWEGHAAKMPIIQAMHMVWSLGSALGPFVSEFFLIELHRSPDPGQQHINGSNYIDLNYSAANAPPNETGVMTSPVPKFEREGLWLVKYAYIAMGLMDALLAVPFVIIAVVEPKKRDKLRRLKSAVSSGAAKSEVEVILTGKDESIRGFDNTEIGTKISSKITTKQIQVLILIFLFMFSFINLFVLPATYYVSYSIKNLNWSVKQSSSLMTIYYTSMMISRLVCIPVSHWISAEQMLIGNTLIAVIGYLLLLPSFAYPPLMWVSTAVAGVGVGPTFATLFLWISDIMILSSKISAVAVLSACTGSTLAPLYVGALMTRVAPEYLIYSLVASAVLHGAITVVMLIFAHKNRGKFE